MEIVRSRRGADQICFGGYTYRKNKTQKLTQSWRCVLADCRGTATTVLNYGASNTGPTTKGEHNHPPEPSNTQAKVALKKMGADAVRQLSVPPRRIIGDITSALNGETNAIFPKYENLAKRIRRERSRTRGSIPVPESLEQLQIPDEYRKVKIGETEERFLLHDDQDNAENLKEGNKRVIIFATDAMLEQLSATSVWMCDGTFKVVPSIFYQLYTIHAVRDEFVFPCAYILLADKKGETYRRAFQLLKKNSSNKLEPNIVSLDFERAGIIAFMEVFRGVSIQGCFFHLSQSIWRKIQALGITSEYLTNENCRLCCKMLGALAFLPSTDIPLGFEHLSKECEKFGVKAILKDLFDYFEEFYVGKKMENGTRRAPLSPPEIWSVRERTSHGIPRTNNSVEGWHRAIQSLYDCAHPNIWSFLKGLQREEGLQRAKLKKFIKGEKIKSTKRQYEEVNERLRKLITRYEGKNAPMKEFLEGVAYNIHFNM